MARYIAEEPGFAEYVRMVERLPTLDRERELTLARQWRDDGEQRAADALVEGHLRSVVKLAQKYRGYGIYLSDLVAEGNIGLLEAVRRFDPERGLRFLTYARYWVRAHMLAHILKHWSIVDLGTTALQSKLFFRLQAEHARLAVELGDEPQEIEARLADHFNTSPAHVRASLLRLGRRDASLDTPVLPGSGTTFLDMLEGGDSDQEERTASAEIASLVHAAVAEVRPTLDCRERKILDERLLPSNGDSVTLAALGRDLGVTRERVRQLEVGIKRRLRGAIDQVFGPSTEYGGSAAAAA
jgi:RNA polymerase sigma-32 factor